MCYDSNTSRLNIILPTHAALASWRSKCILLHGDRHQLLCPAIMERDDIASSSTSITPPTHNILQYQVIILVHKVVASTVQAILSADVSFLVMSVVRGISMERRCMIQLLCRDF